MRLNARIEVLPHGGDHVGGRRTGASDPKATILYWQQRHGRTSLVETSMGEGPVNWRSSSVPGNNRLAGNAPELKAATAATCRCSRIQAGAVPTQVLAWRWLLRIGHAAR